MDPEPARRSRLGVVLMIVPVVWLVALAIWAAQPMTEHMVVGASDDRAVTQRIECNAPLDPDARDASEALPPLDDGFEFTREPCARTHRDARLALLFNAAAAGGLFAAGAVVLTRRPRPTPPDASANAGQPAPGG